MDYVCRCRGPAVQDGLALSHPSVRGITYWSGKTVSFGEATALSFLLCCHSPSFLPTTLDPSFTASLTSCPIPISNNTYKIDTTGISHQLRTTNLNSSPPLTMWIFENSSWTFPQEKGTAVERVKAANNVKTVMIAVRTKMVIVLRRKSDEDIFSVIKFCSERSTMCCEKPECGRRNE